MIDLRPVQSRKYLSRQLVWFLLWLGVTLVAAYLTPSHLGHGTHTELGLPPCPSVLYFGRPCPGCGLTTSFSATVHGELGLAFHAHPLGPILYLLFTLSAWISLYCFLTKRLLDLSSKRFMRFASACLIGFLAFGVARFLLSPDYGDHDPYHQLFVQAQKLR